MYAARAAIPMLGWVGTFIAMLAVNKTGLLMSRLPGCNRYASSDRQHRLRVSPLSNISPADVHSEIERSSSSTRTVTTVRPAALAPRPPFVQQYAHSEMPLSAQQAFVSEGVLTECYRQAHLLALSVTPGADCDAKFAARADSAHVTLKSLSANVVSTILGWPPDEFSLAADADRARCVLCYRRAPESTHGAQLMSSRLSMALACAHPIVYLRQAVSGTPSSFSSAAPTLWPNQGASAHHLNTDVRYRGW
jgi:hypothetical protein